MTAGLRLLVLFAATLLAAQQKDHSTSPGFAAYQRANRFFIEKQFQKSLDAVEEALRLDPALTPALTLKAKLALAVNRYDLARQVLREALSAEPSSAYARFLFGFTLHLQNEMPQALRELEKARQLDPSDARTTLYLGLTHESLGNLEQARGFYEETIRLEKAAGKPLADTLVTYARFLMVLGRTGEAARVVDQALKLEPRSRDAHYERARLLLSVGDAVAAAAAAEQALLLTTPGVSDRQIHYLLVKAYRLSGQDRKAEKYAAELRKPDQAPPGSRLP